jgi:hypothetical protein
MKKEPRTTAQRRAEGRLFAPRTFSHRTRQRFAADRRAELARHLGRPASYAERILIERVIANEWDLRKLDARDDVEKLSGHAMRARFAMENRLRLDLRELGMRGASAPRAPSLAEYLAAKAEASAAAG